MKKNKIKLNPISEERIKDAIIMGSMNHKGGCGKTTMSLSFGIQMVRLGKNVLFVDIDPQSNMSQRLGLSDKMHRDKRISTLFRMSDDEKIEKNHKKYSLIIEYPYLIRAKDSRSKPGVIGILGGSQTQKLKQMQRRND